MSAFKAEDAGKNLRELTQQRIISEVVEITGIPMPH